MALVLSSRGVGSVESILRMRSDLAMDAWSYHEYLVEYAETDAALNRREDKT